MECFNIQNLDSEVSSFDPSIKPELTSEEKRRWKELQEFQWCRPFIDFLKTKAGLQYELICKNSELEGAGEDTYLSTENKNIADIHIQLTHAKEYDMRPSTTDPVKTIDVSGDSVVDSATRKCKHYCDRNVSTKEITLLIQGVDESTTINDLAKSEFFLKKFQDLPCFNGIYYITPNKVLPLKS